MSRSKRIRKTLTGRLLDLDAHFFLLQEAIRGLCEGEYAYLKSLSAELRVLVCLSSGTEGLLWRLAEELNVQDHVHVHLPPGGIEKNHPLANGLQLAFIPIARAGMGDPRLPQVWISLKGIIKECMAVYISERCITHEQLIKAVAQQMGSAHEDQGVDPFLVELNDTILSNNRPIITILVSDAFLVLEVGERVLERAKVTVGFQRKHGTAVISQNLTQKFMNCKFSDDIVELEHSSLCELPKEGTLFFCLDHPHKDWIKNKNIYSFGRFKKGPLTVAPTKYPDGNLEIIIEGLSKEPKVARHSVPESKQPGVSVAVTWKKGEASIYFNGKLVETIRI